MCPDVDQGRSVNREMAGVRGRTRGRRRRGFGEQPRIGVLDVSQLNSRSKSLCTTLSKVYPATCIGDANAQPAPERIIVGPLDGCVGLKAAAQAS